MADEAATPEEGPSEVATADDATPAVVDEAPVADPADAAGGGDVASGMSSGPDAAPMSEAETVTVPVEADAATGDAASEVEVPAAAEAAVVASAPASDDTSSDEPSPTEDTSSSDEPPAG